MVFYALVGPQRKTSVNDKDVIDELMGLKDQLGRSDNLNTSSFNLDEIHDRVLSEKYINSNTALINSLYAQVEFLREESKEKNKVIEALINNNTVRTDDKS